MTTHTPSTPGTSAPRPLRRQSGFTIAEVMMAAIVMAFAISTSITTLQRGYRALDTARNITIAGQIMQSEFEKMRLRDWSVIDAYTGTTASPAAVTVDSSFTSNAFIGNRFTMTRSNTLVRTGMRQITLTVTWTNYDGRSISRSYTSYYGQNGLYDYFYNSL